MTAYDQRARALAGRMLAPVSAGGKGQVVTLKATGQGARNASTGTRTVTVAPQTTSGVEEAYEAGEIDGTLIKIGDRRFRMSPFTTAGALLSPAPAVGHIVTLGGADYRVEAVDALAPAGLAICYVLQLRGP